MLVGLVSFFLAAHDLGKFSYRFQAKNPDAVRLLGCEPLGTTAPTERHDRLGWRLWDESARSLVESGLLGQGRGRKWLRYWRAWGRAFLGHHGIPPDLSVSVAERPVSEDFRPEDQQASDAYLSEMAQLFDLPRLLSHLPETTTDVDGQESLERGSWFWPDWQSFVTGSGRTAVLPAGSPTVAVGGVLARTCSASGPS